MIYLGVIEDDDSLTVITEEINSLNDLLASQTSTLNEVRELKENEVKLAKNTCDFHDYNDRHPMLPPDLQLVTELISWIRESKLNNENANASITDIPPNFVARITTSSG